MTHILRMLILVGVIYKVHEEELCLWYTNGKTFWLWVGEVKFQMWSGSKLTDKTTQWREMIRRVILSLEQNMR